MLDRKFSDNHPLLEAKLRVNPRARRKIEIFRAALEANSGKKKSLESTKHVHQASRIATQLQEAPSEDLLHELGSRPLGAPEKGL